MGEVAQLRVDLPDSVEPPVESCEGGELVDHCGGIESPETLQVGKWTWERRDHVLAE